jgi:eukaryotic-like serine/threonine-protein kinase
MSLRSGTQVGPYQILGPVGVGGMGEVYRARDTKLGREVALKVLPDRLAQDPDRITRFTREAQLSAALNHPNIASIYGIEEAGGTLALVLEYVDGETLAERINKGPLSVAEVLRIAVQIAQALEAAHEKTVVHRDLKPANVKISSEGTVKVLDFGLAKALQDEPSSAPHLSQSPTLSIAATSAGVILGTAGYMSPEQVRGLPVDRRSDIWAFGVVLFEMLSARRVFQGQTVADTLVNVLERQPEWTQLPRKTPLVLRRLIQRCLVKEPKDRLQAIGDARTALEELIADPASQEVLSERITVAYPLWKRVLPWAAAPVALAIGFVLRPAAAPANLAPTRFEIPLPPNHLLFHGYRRGVEISPDGQRIAFISRNPANGTAPHRIYIKSLDQWDAIPVPGTENTQNLFFSPDGLWIGFEQGQQIKKVALAGGTPTVLVEKLNNPATDWGPPGIAWGKDGTIVFPHSLGTGLSIVRDSGGEAEEFTTLNREANESSHRLPHFLPDGSAVLFTVVRYTTITPDWNRAAIWAKPIKGDRKLVLENALDARYAGNGVLLFSRQGKLFAVRFDPASLSVSGTPVQVVDGVTQALYGSTGASWSGLAQYSVANNGTLVYAPGSIEPPLLSSLHWADRTGKLTPVGAMPPMTRFAARVLPDNKRVAFSELHLNKDIWIFDPVRGTQDRATFEGQNAFPIWSSDGSKMAFRSDRTGPLRIYVATGANTREVTPLTPGPLDVPSSWSADGKELAFTRGFSATGGNTDIYVVNIDNAGEPRALVATPASETFPEFSPDGKWLAYVSNESGRSTLYVQPYPGPGPRVTVASDPPPTEPAWSKNSNELFYRSGARFLSVRYRASASDFIPEKPTVLFDQPAIIGGTSVRASYDVAPDGRFLLNLSNQDSAAERERKIFPASLRLVLNWLNEVQRLVEK